MKDHLKHKSRAGSHRQQLLVFESHLDDLFDIAHAVAFTVHQIDHQVETLPTPNFFALNQSYAIVNTIYVVKKI